MTSISNSINQLEDQQQFDKNTDKENLLCTKYGSRKQGIKSHSKGKGMSLRSKLIWKFVVTLMALFFFAAAYVQHNDPDPYLWMPAYIAPFLGNVVFIFYLPEVENRWFWKWFNVAVVLHCCYCFLLGFWTILHYFFNNYLMTIEGFKVEGVSLLPPATEPGMSMEEGKELLGLCLIISWLAFLYDGNFVRSGSSGIAVGSLLTGLPIFAWILIEIVEKEEKCS